MYDLHAKFEGFNLSKDKITKSWCKGYLETKAAKRARFGDMNLWGYQGYDLYSRSYESFVIKY